MRYILVNRDILKEYNIKKELSWDSNNCRDDVIFGIQYEGGLLNITDVWSPILQKT